MSLHLVSRLCVALALWAFVVPTASAGEKKPNIVVIVADDLGYADLGCQGCKDVPTPNIDTLAKNGVRCTSGYVSCPVCSPTRAGLMTGRYQQRFGHEFNSGPALQASPNFGLPLTQTTSADLLRRLGYRTGLVGKWHLGFQPRLHPLERGFEEFFGFLGGAHSYIDSKADATNPILRGTKVVVEKEYLTDAFTREAVSFIDRHHKEPFFLTVTFNGVHNPLQAPQKYLERFGKIEDKKRRTFAGMLSAVDDGVGAILAKLREKGLEENTLIFFISDNGGPTPETSSRNNPLRGFKSEVYEGGVRIPYLVQWKGRLPMGKTYDFPVIALDVLPTAVRAAGGKAPANVDGVDLAPFLSGKEAGRPHEFLCWRYGKQWAIRKGDMKLVQARGKTMPELFDLAADVGETKDLAAQKPEVVKDLRDTYQKWNSEMIAPLWKNRELKKNKDKTPAPKKAPDAGAFNGVYPHESLRSSWGLERFYGGLERSTGASFVNFNQE